MSDYSTEHKVPTYQIRCMTNADPDFYPTVGPFLAKREIAGELGSAVWDDPGKLWYIAVSDGEAIGMVAYWHKTVCSFWVAPRTRGLSVGYALLRCLMADAPVEATLSTTATDESVGLFESVGFAKTRLRGRYHVCERTGLTPTPAPTPDHPSHSRGI